jgi:hypothetical protein
MQPLEYDSPVHLLSRIELYFRVNIKGAWFFNRSAGVCLFLFPKCNRQSSIQ